MTLEFPSAVPEIPVSHIEKAAAYYETKPGQISVLGNNVARL